jgi:hypothetical protein
VGQLPESDRAEEVRLDENTAFGDDVDGVRELSAAG